MAPKNIMEELARRDAVVKREKALPKNAASKRVDDAHRDSRKESGDGPDITRQVGGVYDAIKVKKTITPKTLTDSIFPSEIGIKGPRKKNK